MNFDRYLTLLDADADLLATTATRDLEAPVPTCPGWTVRDAVLHTGAVYRHKLANIRTQAAAEFRTDEPDGDPVAWFREQHGELRDLLAERGPTGASYTWWPADQTVGFWYRRMAQETAVHRVDVQSAFEDVTPVDEELAVDGIDEVLERFLGGDWSEVTPEEWGDTSPDTAAGKAVVVRTGESAWLVTLHPDRVDVERGHGPSAATVSGEPSELMLWLWGRRPMDAVTAEGDLSVLQALRDRLVIATQ